MKAQDRVARAVEARGYRDGWSDEQYAARQVAKLGEELSELVGCIAAYDCDGERVQYNYEWLLEEAGRAARERFDSPEWLGAAILNAHGAATELADIVVVAFTLADVLGVDVVQAAITKAEADVNRGVRSD